MEVLSRPSDLPAASPVQVPRGGGAGGSGQPGGRRGWPERFGALPVNERGRSRRFTAQGAAVRRREQQPAPGTEPRGDSPGACGARPIAPSPGAAAARTRPPDSPGFHPGRMSPTAGPPRRGAAAGAVSGGASAPPRFTAPQPHPPAGGFPPEPQHRSRAVTWPCSFSMDLRT